MRKNIYQRCPFNQIQCLWLKEEWNCSLLVSMARCVFCNTAPATRLTSHAGLELPFCSSACSRALCSLITDGIPNASLSGPKRRAGEEGTPPAAAGDEKARSKQARSLRDAERTERALRRAGKRAEIFGRRFGVNWDDLPLEIRLTIVSYVPILYFVGREMHTVSWGFKQTVADRAVWRKLYERVARDFLGAPERHAYESISQNGQAILAYYYCRNYYIVGADEPLTPSTGPESPNAPRIVINLDDPENGFHELENPFYFFAILQRAEIVRPKRIVFDIQGRGRPARHFVLLDDETGELEEIPMSPEVEALRVSISEEHFTPSGYPTVVGPLVIVTENGRPVIMHHYTGPGWMTLKRDKVGIGRNYYEAQTISEIMASSCKYFGLRSVTSAIILPRRGTSTISPAGNGARVLRDVDYLRTLLRSARAQEGEIVKHRTTFWPMFGIPDLRRLRYTLELTVPLRVVAIIDTSSPRQDEPLSFSAVLAFDGPFSVESFSHSEGLGWSVPRQVSGPASPWPVGSQPAEFVSLRVRMTQLPFTIPPNISYEQVGLPPNWIQTWMADKPGLQARALNPLSFILFEHYSPLLGEIRLHDGGIVTIFPIERHYLHPHPDWVELEPGNNPIASQIK